MNFDLRAIGRVSTDDLRLAIPFRRRITIDLAGREMASVMTVRYFSPPFPDALDLKRLCQVLVAGTDDERSAAPRAAP